MNWVGVAAKPGSRDALLLARRHGLGRPLELAAAAGSELDPEGIAVIGDDSDLAAVALARLRASPRVPLALLPTGRSDLLRMFAIDRPTLETGASYSTDLGICTTVDATLPFVSHLVIGGRRAAAVTVASHRTWEVPGWRCVVANAQHLSGDTVAPRAALMDGELDVQVHGGSRRRLRRLARRGLHLSERTVWRRSLPSASIDLPSNWVIRADGRAVGSGPCSVRTESAAFDLWI